MKGILFFLCAIALVTATPVFEDEVEEIEIELNDLGCPVNTSIYKNLPHETYCNWFYTCVNEGILAQRCPANLQFDIEEEVCDWPQNVDCGDRIIDEVIPESDEDEEEISPGGNSDPSLAPQICAQPDSDGVLVAHENCNEFYICEGGSPQTVTCPEDLLYNYDSGICDWPRNVECGDRVVNVDRR